MFVLTVAAQCSCNDTYLLPHNGLIWKVYKPRKCTNATFNMDNYNMGIAVAVDLDSHIIQESPR